MKLVLIVLVIGMLCVAGVSYAVINSEDTGDNNVVYNPATGEKWDSVEEYRYRDINITEMIE